MLLMIILKSGAHYCYSTTSTIGASPIDVAAEGEYSTAATSETALCPIKPDRATSTMPACTAGIP